MDDYMFRAHVDSCRNVIESTSYLEILNYTVSRNGSLAPVVFAPAPAEELMRTPSAVAVGQEAQYLRRAPSDSRRVRKFPKENCS